VKHIVRRRIALTFDRVYSDNITQGCAWGALAGWYEPTCQTLLFSYTMSLRHEPQNPQNAQNYRYAYVMNLKPTSINKKCAYIMHSKKKKFRTLDTAHHMVQKPNASMMATPQNLRNPSGVGVWQADLGF